MYAQNKVSLQWKLATHVKFYCYSHRQQPLRLFDRSYYMQENEYGYGRILRPKTEITMHYDCINVLRELNWVLVAHEWYVRPKEHHYGQGDLVFRRNNDYLVVEVKRRNLQHVYKQARYYASAWKLVHSKNTTGRIFYGVWTSYNQEILGHISSIDDAIALCTRPGDCIYIHKNLAVLKEDDAE